MQTIYLYHAGMSTDDALAVIDASLIRLRRLWSTPQRRADLERDVGEGIPMSSVLVVDAVARLGPAGGATIGAVADNLSVDESTASRLVDGAVRAGLVARQRSDVDARRVALTLTDAGHGLLARASAFRRRHLSAVLGGWTDRDVARFAELLDRFADAVDR